jgi:hypothetical protein
MLGQLVGRKQSLGRNTMADLKSELGPSSHGRLARLEDRCLYMVARGWLMNGRAPSSLRSLPANLMSAWSTAIDPKKQMYSPMTTSCLVHQRKWYNMVGPFTYLSVSTTRSRRLASEAGRSTPTEQRHENNAKARLENSHWRRQYQHEPQPR